MSLLHLLEMPMGKVEAGLWVTLIEKRYNSLELTAPAKQAARECARARAIGPSSPFDCWSSLRSKRFQSSYCAKVRAEAKKRFPSPSPVIHFFLLLSQLSRRTSRGNACYAGYCWSRPDFSRLIQMENLLVGCSKFFCTYHKCVARHVYSFAPSAPDMLVAPI